MPVGIVFPYFLAALTLSAPQKRFLTSRRKLKLLNCGRYGGKSFLAMIDCLWTALWLYATRKSDPTWWRPGAVVTMAVFAPTERNFMPLWSALCDLVPKIPGKASDGFNNTEILRGEYRICLFGFLGIQIDLISCWAPDNIRGAGYDIVFLDEAAQLKRPKIFFQQIMPLVSRAGYFGKVVLASTPLNNFWDRWVLSARQGTGRFRNWEAHHWTPFENPRLTEEQRQEILLEREENPAIYRQEFLAQLFVEVPSEETLQGEKVWNPVALEELFVSEYVPVHGPFAVGFDLAWTGDDEAVLLVIDIPTGLVCHIEVFPKTDDAMLLAIMERAHRQWNSPKFYFDRTGGRAKAFADFIPPSLHIHPLVIRRSVDRSRQTDYVVSKDLLVRSVEQRMTLRKLKFPHPEEYPFDRLPWSNEQDQQRNFQKLYRQMLSIVRITIRRANGTEEYLYRPEPVFDPETHKYVAADDCSDALLVAARGLPAITEEHVSIEELEEGMTANW